MSNADNDSQDDRIELEIHDRLIVRELFVVGSDNLPRIHATVTDDGEAVVILKDLLQRTRAAVSVDRNGIPSVTLHDHCEQFRVVLNVQTDMPGLAFLDREGKLRARVFLDDNGECVVSTWNLDGAMKWTRVRLNSEV